MQSWTKTFHFDEGDLRGMRRGEPAGGIQRGGVRAVVRVGDFNCVEAGQIVVWVIEDLRNWLAPRGETRPLEISDDAALSAQTVDEIEGANRIFAAGIDDNFGRKIDDRLQPSFFVVRGERAKRGFVPAPEDDGQIGGGEAGQDGSHFRPIFGARGDFDLLTANLLCLSERLP